MHRTTSTATRTKAKFNSEQRGLEENSLVMSPHRQKRQRRNKQQKLHLSDILPTAFTPMNAFIYTLLIGSVLLVTLPSTTDALEASELRSVKYKEWSRNITYYSSTAYNARGMQPLYNISHTIIKTIMGRDPLPEGYITFDNYTIAYGPKVQRNDWADLLLAHWPLMLIVVVLGILIALMPIVGFCYCICRCAGFCGGRSQTFDKRHDTCRRVFLGFLMIVLTVGVLFGVIIAFANNQYLENGIEKSTDTVMTGSRDTITFLDTTGNQIDHLLVYNYQQLSDQLQESLQETSSYIIGQLEEESSADSLDKLSNFLTTLPAMKDKLERMRTLTNEVRTYASQVSDGLRGVKRDLLTLLTKCSERECKDFMNKYDIGTMDWNGIHYDQLPDLSDIINTVNRLSKGKLIQSSHRGRDVLLQIRKAINETIEPHKTRIITSLNGAGEGLNRTSMRIRTELNSLSNKVGNATNMYRSRSEHLMREYTPYRYYVGMGVSSVMLLVLLLLSAALLCGICGKRPDGYGDDCCNKGAGASFLITAVVIIFLTFSVMAIVALVHFLLGIVAYRGVCIPLEDPNSDSLYRSLDKVIDLNDFLNPAFGATQKRLDSRNRAIVDAVTPKTTPLEPLRFSDVLESCRANQSIYKVLRLKNRINIDDIKEFPERYKIQKYVSEMVDGIVLDPKDMVMLTPEEKQAILEITESSLVNFDQQIFIDNLNHTITKHPLPELAARLRETAKNLKGAEQREVQVGLRNQALHLETYEMNLVIPMRNESAQLLRLAKELESVLIYKGRRLPEFIPMLLKEIEGAENFIKTEGAQFVRGTAQNYSRYFMGEIERYLGIVVESVENKIGYCAPLANVYAAGKTTICNRIVDPLNGFWLGAFLCLIIFLPTICVATKLASLYKKSDPYPGPMVESEYLYDAYSERDHIPLANGPKNKRRKNKDRRRGRGDYYEDSIGPGSHVVPTTAAAAGVRDTRYNDMAPKHWDGGPPRYQNPPMAPPASEYERPPPYYYPGATEQD